MGQEIFPVMRGGAGMGQEKSMRGGDEDPILRPRSAPLPSLHVWEGSFVHNSDANPAGAARVGSGDTEEAFNSQAQ